MVEPDLAQPGVVLPESASTTAFALDKLQVLDAKAQAAQAGGPNLESLSELELLTLRQRIDTLLPHKALADMNLEQELVAQYQLAKLLQNNVNSNSEKGVTDKDKGHLLRMATQTLESLMKHQNSVYTSERLKFVEIALESALGMAGTEVKQAFFDRYQALLKENGAKSAK